MLQNNPTPSASPPSSNNNPYLQLQTEEPKQRGFLQWWYRLSLFPEPSTPATIEELELYRRGKTISQLMLGVAALIGLLLPVAIMESILLGGFGYILLLIAAVHTVFLLLCTWLNRIRQVTIAALLTTGCFMVAPMMGVTSTIGTQHGIDFSSLPGFHILAFAIMVAAATLPRKTIPILLTITVLNCTFIVLTLTVFPQSTGPMRIPREMIGNEAIAPIIVQVLIATVSILWTNGISHALQRANRAEEIARLEHNLSQKILQDAEKKRHLEESILLISETHKRVANGDYQARVPLRNDNMLWQISGLLNNLLSRFQNLLQRVSELERTNEFLHTENARLTQTVNDLGRQPENPRETIVGKGISSDLDSLPRSASPKTSKSQWS